MNEVTTINCNKQQLRPTTTTRNIQSNGRFHPKHLQRTKNPFQATIPLAEPFKSNKKAVNGKKQDQNNNDNNDDSKDGKNEESFDFSPKQVRNSIKSYTIIQ
jgi:hypothetical protein